MTGGGKGWLSTGWGAGAVCGGRVCAGMVWACGDVASVIIRMAAKAVRAAPVEIVEIGTMMNRMR